jgi:hypothetical protein
MLKHYVEFLTPGVFFPEEENREVKDRVPANLKRIPKYTYAICFYDVERIKKGEEVLSGRAKNKSCRIIFGEKVHWTKVADTNENRILRSNLEFNGYRGYGIKCITGNWQSFLKDDIVLSKYTGLKTLVGAL